jgi:biotin transport system substrate-specific component
MTLRIAGRILFFAGLIAALGLVPKLQLAMLGPVPITAQGLGVMLAGIFLGPRNGAIAAALFLLAVALDVPVLAGGRSGLGVFTGPTAGFLFGFVPGAFAAGWVMERWSGRLGPLAGGALAGFIGGYVVLNLIGIPVMAWLTSKGFDTSMQVALGLLPGGVIKAVLAGLAAFLFRESLSTETGDEGVEFETRDLVRISLFAAIIASLGLLPKFDLPVAGGVPITAQSMGVMLAGVVLGARQGALSVLLFLFVVALGAPLLAGGRGGLAPFFGAGGGFIIGFVPAAFACGMLMERLSRLPLLLGAMLASVIGGIGVLYLFGVPWLAWKTNITLMKAIIASTVFIPGDLLKAVAVGFVAEAISRAAPQSAPKRGRA